jgi:hypothetical protein
MGAGFTDHGLVFCRPDGVTAAPERFRRTFTEQAAKALVAQLMTEPVSNPLAAAAGEDHD